MLVTVCCVLNSMHLLCRRAYIGLSVLRHRHVFMDVHTCTLIQSDKWVIVFWIQHGIFHFNILSLLGINTFLPHTFGIGNHSVRLCGNVFGCQQQCPSGYESTDTNKGHCSLIHYIHIYALDLVGAAATSSLHLQ